VVVVLLSALWMAASAASASAELSSKELEKLPEITEWVYRNSVSAESGEPCHEACVDLWRDEHGTSSTGESQELWDQLGTLETGEGLWPRVHNLLAAFDSPELGGLPISVGWEMGSSERKWLDLWQARAPHTKPMCGGPVYDDLMEPGLYDPSEEPPLELAKYSYVAHAGICAGYSISETVGQETVGGYCPEEWSGFVQSEAEWTAQRHKISTSTCLDTTIPAQEVRREIITATRPFHFARPEEGAEPAGATTHHVYNSPEVNKTEQATPKEMEEYLPGYLSGAGALNEWIVYHLLGEGNDPTQQPVALTELYGFGNPGFLGAGGCFKAKPVDCATGNQVVAQTDLTVGGRGPSLELTRTYNSQLAAAQTAPGPFGYGWTDPYAARLVVNEANKTATVYQGDGSAAVFVENKEGAFVPPNPLMRSTLVKEGSSYVYTLPDQTKLAFNSSGQLASETDRNGNALTMAYNAKAQLESVSDAGGHKLTFAYNGEGLVESVTDPMGHAVKYTYEEDNLASVTQPGETSLRWQFKYNSEHELTSETDGRGKTTTTEYNEYHQVVAQTDAMSRKHTWRYIQYEKGSETLITEPNGSLTVERFNEYGSPISVTQAAETSLAATTTYEYNSSDEPLDVVNPNGDETEYGYNANGDRTSETNADKDETKWEYDSTHDLTGITQPNGEKTTIERDSHGNALKVSRPAPGETTQVTKYKYDSHGDVEVMTDPLGHEWKYEYDGYGDRSAETDPEGNKRTWGYNEDSQETSTVSPRGHVKGAKESSFTTTIERTAKGRVKAVINPLKDKTEYTYDADGDVEAVTDPELNKTTYTYNADDEPTKTEEPNKTITEAEYNSEGQVVAQIDGNKHTTKYERNALGEVTEEIDPLSQKTKKEYDAAGNLVKLVDAASRTTTYKYDPANRLVEVSYSDGKTPTVKYEYNSDGDRTKMVDGTGETVNEYDQLDRLKESKNGHGETVKYEYNLDNNPVKITYPNGKAITRSYDNDDRLKSVTDWLEHTTSFAYDPDSDLASTTFPTTTGDVDPYSYNDADEMTEVEMNKGSEALASIAYTRDKDGGVTKDTTKGAFGEEKPAFSYDENSRVTKGAGVTYKYDAANNATTIGGDTYAYNSADELETATASKKTADTYTFNEVGQRTKTAPASGPATSYAYNEAGNLTAVTRPKEGETPAVEDSYAYNGEGLRASETVGGTTSYLAWDTAELELPLILSNGADSFVYGPGGVPVEQINNEGHALYLHHDQQGSTRLLTGETGKTETTFTYGAYGETTGHTGTATTPLGYDGQYTSSDTGLIYMRARTYDPVTSQFLSRDPLTPITREPYSYAEDNPVDREDRSGLGSGFPEGEISAPCVWPFCSPPPSATGGVEQIGKGIAEGGRNAGEDVVHGAEGVVNWIAGEGESSGENTSAGVSGSECGERNPAQDKKLSPGQIKKLKEAGFDPHELKLGAGEDLYTDSEGNIYAKPQDGTGPGEPIGINIKNLP
jgi:RHS repeat-associated protein